MKFIRDFSISWCLLCFVFADLYLYDMGCTKSSLPTLLAYFSIPAGLGAALGWSHHPRAGAPCQEMSQRDIQHPQEVCAFHAKRTSKRWLIDAVRCTCFVFFFVCFFLATIGINARYWSATACGDKAGLCWHLLTVRHPCTEQIPPRSVHACTARVVWKGGEAETCEGHRIPFQLHKGVIKSTQLLFIMCSGVFIGST